MGLFNTLKFQKVCLFCGKELDNWQTKDLVIDDIYHIMNGLDVFELNDRMDATASDYCQKCKKGFNVVIKKGNVGNLKPWKEYL